MIAAAIETPSASGVAPPGFGSRRWSMHGTMFRGALAGLLIVASWELIWLLFLGNVHVVIPGQVYRSSQPSAQLVARMVRDYGIKTIINLRGYCEGSDWYDEEQRAAAKLGLSIEDLTFSANRLPSTTELRRLIEVLDRSERPILIHCFRGVDRTGLGSVIAMLLYTDTPLDEALGQLSLRYLHLSVGRTGHLDRFFGYYKEWLRGRNEEHSPANFRTWVQNVYTAGPCSCRIELIGQPVSGPADPRRTVPRVGRSDGNHLPTPLVDHFDRQDMVSVPGGRPFALQVRCHNTSVETWRFNANLNTGIHGTWQLRQGGKLILQDRFGAFPVGVPPGCFIDLWIPLPSLASPAPYQLMVGLYEENHGHFHEQGADFLEIALEAR